MISDSRSYDKKYQAILPRLDTISVDDLSDVLVSLSLNDIFDEVATLRRIARSHLKSIG